MAPQCTALNLSDQTRCDQAATSLNGFFCSFHSKQCQGMYKGYKRRNAEFDALVETLPAYLAKSTVALVNQTFKDVELLNRLILARKLHHEHFFALNYDYGHAHYLGKLQQERLTTLRALERLERRTADVLYQQRKWFKWVRQCQDEEEAHRTAQAIQVKREAALFKRHRKELEQRTKELRKKEDLKRQEQYLAEAYQERLSQEDVDAEWDPVDDVIEDERGNYIDLINYFLMLKDNSEENTNGEGNTGDNGAMSEEGLSVAEASTNSKNVKKRARKTKSSQQSTETSSAEASPLREGKITMETRSQIRKRLSEGVTYAQGAGILLRGTIENPIELAHKTAPIPEREVLSLLSEIAEIKHLLFCRLLLSHASLLPAALRANSVEEFLNDREVADADLRDLCLKMEKPGIQEVRDACADLIRGDEDDEIDEIDEETDGGDEDGDEMRESRRKIRPTGRRHPDAVPVVWHTKREREMQKRRNRTQKFIDKSLGETGGTVIEFGALDREGHFQNKKMRVKVCGRYIYNYPSEKALTRGGWLHFSIIAKDSSFYDAIQLCRSWDEFFELNILAVYQYFPAANWLVGDRLRSQLLQLGFIPYFQFNYAAETSVHHQTGSRGQGRRSHVIRESRNFICGHIKRNDAASRRFIQYLSMDTSHVVCFIRDAVTGKTLVSPPETQLWLLREKHGLGRASKNEWNVISEVGPEFFEDLEQRRKWHFGFNEYYDVYVWDVVPGEHFSHVYNTVQTLLIKAHRFCSVRELYELEAPVLKTLMREPGTRRARDARPGEETIYDEVHSANAQFISLNERGEKVPDSARHKVAEATFYNEADAAEDRILFSEEPGRQTNAHFRENLSSMTRFENSGPDVDRFVLDLDTDEEIESEDEDNEGSLYASSQESIDDVHDGEQSKCNSADTSADEEGLLECFSKDFSESLVLSEREMLMSNTTKNIKAPSETVEYLNREFMSFIDREKSKVFKESWHKADLEPGAQLKYSDALRMVKRMVTYNLLALPAGMTPFAKLLRSIPGVTEHRRSVNDMFNAFAAMSLFFSLEFYESEAGTDFKDTSLIKQEERAKQLPDRRRYDSNKCMPKEFWQEWDAIIKKAKREHGGHVDQAIPFEWHVAIRPIIAHLYKSGVIGLCYREGCAGWAIGSREPGRDLDLYFDFRGLVDTIQMNNPDMQDPRQVTRHTLLNAAREFAKAHPKARFAVLRIWSAPHFYPLMIGYDRRAEVSFLDTVGRYWEWKFIPKDMPCSEWSIHHQARLRIRPYKASLGDKVLVKRDLYLVMGEDEVDLLKLAATVTYAVQTEPWRLEIDLWKSFVNVDMAFLDGLHNAWLD